MLSLIDSEPFSRTQGCADRLFWGWKFTDFPGARFQEVAFSLAWLYSYEGVDNPWKKNQRLLERLDQVLDFWIKSQHRDGSLDEAYPWERSFAATAFTLFYATEACRRVRHTFKEERYRCLLEKFTQSGNWLLQNDEKHGLLSNHLGAAVVALQNLHQMTGVSSFAERSQYFLNRILEHQSEEGWYSEYGGCDPGYQTHATFYLSIVYREFKDKALLESLRRANRCLSHFVQPDGSVGGEYASRNTTFYYPAAFEILKGDCPYAKSIAEAQREPVRRNETVGLATMDPQNFFPLLNNYMFAEESLRSPTMAEAVTLPMQITGEWRFEEAALFVKSTRSYFAVLSLNKGGVLKVWDRLTCNLRFESSGYFLKRDGRIYTSQGRVNSKFQFKEHVVEVESHFVELKQKIFSTPLFLIFRLYSLVSAPFPRASYWMKRKLVKTLVSGEKSIEVSLKRQVKFESDQISITDAISPENTPATHCDRFCSIHMGSSRYSHGPQEAVLRSQMANPGKTVVSFSLPPSPNDGIAATL